MSTNFYFKTLNVNNYRGLDELKIDSLRRINLLGGFNGTGKSTLLEAIFLLLDRRNPTAIIRPYASRNLQPSFPDGLDYVFGRKGKQESPTIKTRTREGELKLTLTKSPAPPAMSVSTQNSQALANPSPSTIDSGQLGIHLLTTLNGSAEDSAFVTQMSQEQINFVTNAGKSTIASATIISSQSRPTAIEDAQRYSMLIKERRTGDVVSYLRFLNPRLKGFQLLQEGNQPTLYAEMEDAALIPTSMLGGGFQTVLSVVLVMMTTRNGVILFDEVDSTIHFTRLAFFWALVARLADKENCQVFAVTHSRECIASAISGISECGQLQSLQYIRLENDDGGTDAVVYSGEELSDAVSAGWEIR